MAKSTCDPNAEVPKGMMKFEVIRSTIRDSLGQYCEPGDMAVLTKKIAKGYLDKNWIKVALPEFDDDGDESDTTDEGGADAAERTEAATSPRRGTAERRARIAADRK